MNLPPAADRHALEAAAELFLLLLFLLCNITIPTSICTPTAAAYLLRYMVGNHPRDGAVSALLGPRRGRSVVLALQRRR